MKDARFLNGPAPVMEIREAGMSRRDFIRITLGVGAAAGLGGMPGLVMPAYGLTKVPIAQTGNTMFYHMLYTAMDQGLFKQEGIEIEVVDPRTLSPLDIETLATSARKTGRVVVAHEAPTFGGFGGEIVAQIVEHAWDDLRCPPRRVGAAWAPVPYALALENAVLPQESDLEAAVRAVLALCHSEGREARRGIS